MKNPLRTPFRYSYTNMTGTIIIINIAVYIALSFMPRLSLFFSLIPAFIKVRHFYWQIFTYQFIHAGFWHLFFNMLTLWFIGSMVERRIGSKEFLLFYLLIGTLCGFGAYTIYSTLGWYTVQLVGASGAVFAVLLLFSVLFPDMQLLIWGIIPIPAPILMIGYILFEIFDMLVARDNVAHLVHLLGILFAWLYIRIRYRVKPLKVWKVL